MAVSSVNNKPVLPRTTDGSDLGSNRASIYSGKGLSFDGANDTVAINNPEIFYSFGGEITIAVWAKWTYSNDTEELFRIENGANRILFSFQTSNILSFGTKGINGGYGELDISITNYLPIIDGRWAYYVATHDAQGNKKVYINGELIGSGVHSGGIYATGNATPYIGSSAGTGEFFTGQMSDFKFFDVALTQDQIKELQINPEQKVPTGVDALRLKAHYPMTEGAGSYLYNANANAIGTELISNAGFDETCQKWGTTDSSTVEIAGGKAIWSNAPLSGSFVEQPLELEVGKFYRVKFDYTSTAFNIFVNLGDTQEAVPLGNGTYVKDMYYGTGTSSLKFKHGYTSDSSASIDNVSIKEVVPNFYNGTINGATWVQGLPEPLPQTALMDWNKGTNLLPYSESFQTAWSYGNTSITADQTNAPNNTFTADKSTVNSSSAYHDSLLKNVTTTSGVLYEVSIYAKKGQGINGIYFYQGNGSRIAKWNLNDGTYIGHANGNSYAAYDSYGSENAGNGWFRFWARYTAINGSGNFTVGISPNTSDSVVTYTGNGTDYLYIWGANYASSPSSQPSPYIRTEATAQTTPVLIQEGSTSGKDVFGNTISKPRASGAYNFDGNSWVQFQSNNSLEITGSITLEFWARHKSTDAVTYDHIIGRRDNNDANWLRVYRAANKSIILEGYGGTNISGHTTVDGTWYHFAATLSGTDATIYINGTQYNAGTLTWNIANEAAPWTIGAWIQNTSPVSNSYTNGSVANPRIYNYALTAEQVADNFNEKASTFGGTKVASEFDAYIERTASDGATVEAHSCLVNYLTELDKK